MSHWLKLSNLILASWLAVPALSLTPAIVQIYHYPPNEYCDTVNQRDQSSFSGQEFELTDEITQKIEWVDEDYDIEYFCICCSSYVLLANDDYHLNETGAKYLFTA